MVLTGLLSRFSKISFGLAITLTVGAFIIGWIAFGVPDWLSYNLTLQNEHKFGLWRYCKQAVSLTASGYTCKSWKKNGVTAPGKSCHKAVS
jgi:hypothetical protein